ncbi:hypothetical protein OHA79_44815 (plasmid) [Streptomyces sp. NBC_00841]|uniref:hypothetical protein n=1 Tax=unclassified Streptomyces TaxID=2593676 RepID=UPI00225A0F3B|nr:MULTISPECIES: hypothetical protein [unclassified Streptomyces]MCX4538966.1 hypothetical protein [Streptomyces sp. NBC_01669]WSA04802.1 hypothetical protein OHA79_44815 [Streptomyces sp. NBC_00841]
MSVEANLSDLLNKPKVTLAALRGARRIRLRRRDDEDLVLTTAARAEQDSTVLGATTRMFVEMMRTPEGRTLVLDVLPATFPWVRYLPAHDVRDFSVELVGALGAAADLDSTAAVAQLITEWRHTAEVHADPELYAALTTDSGKDYGPVPEPEAAA